ncbi:hypothetical protein [Roseivirga sp. UBA838]|uniref:DUF6970 domain-containing protein n=1 Tax=Roseivirga sp. UBA838 TaxID=1947393 RepID=UPI00257A1055|nr:hypothetical protein [Roseivirga sp. UBA838]|tara:strand:- start:36582 stop:36932 length:351 start_codon:yes stop_codon:yes gene_type:complete
MKKLIASTFLLLLALSCDNKGIPVDLPSCIQDQIKTVALNSNVRSPERASVEAYLYNGQRVYVFNPGSGYADWLYTFYNEDCQVVCESGGFAGVNTCPDFNEKAEFLGVVWRDSRP